MMYLEIASIERYDEYYDGVAEVVSGRDLHS